MVDHLHWQSRLAKSSAKATLDSHMAVNTVLAFATLGGNQKIEIVVPLKMAKASEEGNIAGIFSGIIALYFANEKTA